MRILIIPAFFITLNIVLLTLFSDHFEFPDSVEDAVIWLKSFDQWAWAIASAFIIGDVLLPLPTDPTIFTLGIIYGGLLGGLIGGSAATIAGLLGYSITRVLGEKGALFLLGKTDLERARKFYDRQGFIAIALGRAIGGPAEYLVVIAGLTNMPFKTVFLAIVTGAFPSAFCMAFLGTLAITNPVIAIVLATTVVLTLIAVFKFAQKSV